MVSDDALRAPRAQRGARAGRALPERRAGRAGQRGRRRRATATASMRSAARSVGWTSDRVAPQPRAPGPAHPARGGWTRRGARARGPCSRTWSRCCARWLPSKSCARPGDLERAARGDREAAALDEDAADARELAGMRRLAALVLLSRWLAAAPALAAGGDAERVASGQDAVLRQEVRRGAHGLAADPGRGLGRRGRDRRLLGGPLQREPGGERAGAPRVRRSTSIGGRATAPSPRRRGRAAWAWPRSSCKPGQTQHLPVLKAGLSDSSKTVRYYAALQLGWLGQGRRACPPCRCSRRSSPKEKDEDLVERAKLMLLRLDPSALANRPRPGPTPRASAAPAPREAPAARPASWIRVRVYEQGAKDPEVSINLPLGLAELVFKSLPDDARQGPEAQGLRRRQLLGAAEEARAHRDPEHRRQGRRARADLARVREA